MCLSAFAGSSECKGMDHSETENRWKEHNPPKLMQSQLEPSEVLTSKDFAHV